MERDDLYQGILLDHFRNPRHRVAMEAAAAAWQERNPACGDVVLLQADLSQGRLDRLVHDTRGCAISVASASIMTGLLEGLPVAEAGKRAADVCAFLRGDDPLPADADDRLAALATVRAFPMRLKCALLPWVGLGKWLAQGTGSNP